MSEKIIEKIENERIIEPRFRTQYNVFETLGEDFDDEYLVEKGGYVPANILIEQMIAAGRRLDDMRYDEYFGNDDEESIPFEVPDDQADAYDKARTAAQRFKVRKAEAEKAAAEKAAAEKAAAEKVAPNEVEKQVEKPAE